MSEESGEPSDEPVAEVESELGSVGRELRFLASTRPLRSTALSAQIQESLNVFASQAVAAAFPRRVLLDLANQMASISTIDTKKLLASIQDAVGSPGFRDALRLSFTPSFTALTSAATYSAG